MNKVVSYSNYLETRKVDNKAISDPRSEPMADVEYSLTTEQAKAKVFEYWTRLDILSKRRFPKDGNLAHEALMYVLDHLETNHWQRIRAWQGLGEFLPFLLTITSRLLTDFSRSKFGHIRKPAWLQEKSDPLWDKAYQLLIIEQYTRQETIAYLLIFEPPREVWFIEEVVKQIREKCQLHPHSKPENIAIEDCVEPCAINAEPDDQLLINDREVLEVLQSFLEGQDLTTDTCSSRVQELIVRLKQSLTLTEEDRMLLRLRYRDGVNMNTIVKLMKLTGDPYKRFNKIIAQIRDACQREGITL